MRQDIMDIDILKDFPDFELSYELVTHKKVYDADIVLAIPEGQKSYLWFTSYKDNDVCFTIDCKTKEVKIELTSFDDKLCLGTLFYGTMFRCENVNNFCIEDIYYYKGKFVGNMNYINKLELLKNMFKNEMSQIALTKDFLIIGLPIISKNVDNIFDIISNNLLYKISEIKYRYFCKGKTKKIVSMNYCKNNSVNKNGNNKINAIFKITPDIEPDIYNLFIFNDEKEDYYDIAYIPDYNTSKMMNKLFRKIKENDNLDAIEESDDESEFEDEREDKFVYLDKSYKMNCEYNQKFKKWIPINIVDKNEKLVTSNKIGHLLEKGKSVKKY